MLKSDESHCLPADQRPGSTLARRQPSGVNTTRNAFAARAPSSVCPQSTRAKEQRASAHQCGVRRC
eukprot:13202529-Alexandrium_andersonii.AAC.1